VTITAGLRWDVQRPFYAQNNSYSTATLDDIFGVTGVGSGFQPGSVVTNLGNLFKPGTLQGKATTFKMLQQGTNAYNVDWGGFARPGRSARTAASCTRCWVARATRSCAAARVSPISAAA
jgi:hypothetical protein